MDRRPPPGASCHVIRMRGPAADRSALGKRFEGKIKVLPPRHKHPAPASGLVLSPLGLLCASRALDQYSSSHDFSLQMRAGACGEDMKLKTGGYCEAAQSSSAPRIFASCSTADKQTDHALRVEDEMPSEVQHS